jgi:amino acid transporter
MKKMSRLALIVLAVASVAPVALADLAPGPFGGGGSIVNVIVAGFFLAASIAFGGIWLARYRRREGPKRKAVLVAVMIVAGLVAVLALADLVFVVAADGRVPDRFPLSAGTLTRAVPNGEALSGEVRIRIADKGDQITLTLPKPR